MYFEYVLSVVMMVQNADEMLVLTWEGSMVFLQMFLLNGGPTGMLAAFPIVTTGVLAQVLVMAEMASM
jgi:choline transport protein